MRYEGEKESDVERRKYIRLSAIAHVEYRIVGERGLSGRSTTTDMSREGVKFTVTEKLRKGPLLDLEIDIGGGRALIPARVKAVWCKKLGRKREFDLEAIFVEIDPADKDRLLDYAYRSWFEKTREEHRKRRS